MHFIHFDNETHCESVVYEYKNSLTIAEMIRELPSWSGKSYFAALEPSIGFEKS